MTSQSQLTVKLTGNQHELWPEAAPNSDLEFHMELLKKIVFSLWNRKKETLADRGWSAQPVSQKEIYAEYNAKVAEFRGIDRKLGLKGEAKYWPSFAKVHDHNWVERRVNYLATDKFGPRDPSTNLLMIVNTNAKRGEYAPNPKLFGDS